MAEDYSGMESAGDNGDLNLEQQSPDSVDHYAGHLIGYWPRSPSPFHLLEPDPPPTPLAIRSIDVASHDAASHSWEPSSEQSTCWTQPERGDDWGTTLTTTETLEKTSITDDASNRGKPDINLSRPLCWSVPYARNSRFVGREDLLRALEATLFTGENDNIVTLLGPGGVGKTQIVVELAHRTRLAHPARSVFWMRATSAESFRLEYMDIGRQLGIPGLDGVTADATISVKKGNDMARLVQRYMSNDGSGQWLLIVDGADDDDLWLSGGDSGSDVTALVDYLPRSSQGAIAITTRSANIAAKLGHPNVVSVTEMDLTDACRLLGVSLPESRSSTIPCRFLVRQLRCLPLAISLAASYIKCRGIPVSYYLDLLNGVKDEDVIRELSKAFEDQEHYTAARNPAAMTYVISLEHISRNDQTAADLIYYLSCLGPLSIPVVDLAPYSSREETLTALETLSRYSLLEKDVSGDEILLHPMVHLATQHWLRSKNCQAEAAREALTRLAKNFPRRNRVDRARWRSRITLSRNALNLYFSLHGVDDALALQERCASSLAVHGWRKESDKPLTHGADIRKSNMDAKRSFTQRSMAEEAVSSLRRLRNQSDSAEKPQAREEAFAEGVPYSQHAQPRQRPAREVVTSERAVNGGVATRYGSCAQLFNRLTEAFNTEPKDRLELVSKSALLDEYARFQMWAGDAGLPSATGQPRPPASRVEDALNYIPPAAGPVLQELENTLQEGIAVMRGGGKATDDQCTISALQRLLAAVDTESDDEDEDEEEDVEAEQSRSEKLQRVLRDIANSISRLLQLSAIAHTAASAAQQKLDNVPPENLQLDHHFDSQHVREKYPHARSTPWLVEKLGRALTLRRQDFQRRQTSRPAAVEEPSAQSASENMSSRPQTQTATASTSMSYLESEHGGSGTSLATSIYSNETTVVHMPKLPLGAEYGKPFECPCCLQKVTVRDLPSWRKHLFSDLRPYVCTFKECSLRLFKSRRDWFQHELSTHRREWKCGACDHRDSSRLGFTEHLQQRHFSSFTEELLSVFTDMWEGPAEAISPSACPLCHDWDGSVTTVPTVYAKGQSAFPGPVTTRQFRRHLGRHLEELALFALPKYDVAEGDNDHDDEASQSSLDEEEDLDTEALTQLLMELNMAPEGNPDRPAHLHQSSTLLLKRYMKNGNMDDLEHAAALAAQAVAALGRKHPSYTMFLETLDQALKAHPQRKSNFMGITLMSNSGDDLLFSTHTLHEGARLGLASVVRYLVAKGVNDALEDTSRTNALHVAANIGQLEVVQVLLDAGADIRACNDIGWTALHLACAKGDEAVARTLLDKGAALEAATRDTGRTALYLAVASKSIKLVTLLLDRGADVSVRDRSGSTVLSYPASTGQLEMVKLLLDRNAVPSLSNQLGITPLHRAAGMGHVAVVRLLLERADVDVDARDVHNMSALHVAAEKGHEAVVRLLLERGDGTADPRNITGKTPLHFAIENGYEEVVRLLLSSDIVDVGASDANGQTALHIAAEKAHEAIVRLLLDFGASSTARNNAGQTPLDRAVLAGRTQVANVLRPGATSSYVWFCGHCGDGPQSPEIDVACPNCGRPRDQFAKIVSYG